MNVLEGNFRENIFRRKIWKGNTWKERFHKGSFHKESCDEVGFQKGESREATIEPLHIYITSSIIDQDRTDFGRKTPSSSYTPCSIQSVENAGSAAGQELDGRWEYWE